MPCAGPESTASAVEVPIRRPLREAELPEDISEDGAISEDPLPVDPIIEVLHLSVAAVPACLKLNASCMDLDYAGWLGAPKEAKSSQIDAISGQQLVIHAAWPLTGL